LVCAAPIRRFLLGKCLFENFETWKEQVVGHGVHESLHAQIKTWEEEYPSA